jgi:hypothetical protein
LYERCHFHFFSTTTYNHHAITPLELPRNFKFKPPYPFPLPQQGEASPSSSSTPPIVLSNDNPFVVMCDSTLEDAQRKTLKIKGYVKKFKKFKMSGLLYCHGLKI